MGLLTDPSAGEGKLVKTLFKYHNKVCMLLYLVGLTWFCALPLPSMNASTYFSENALLPGLVQSKFNENTVAFSLHDELIGEMQKYEDTIPYPWFLAKFKQIGLDAYTHNFTLHSPLNGKEKYSGKNVYGILRAARASSTEALVLSVPYRPPVSVHPSTAPSIAIMLAFATHANKEKYWAKDIIFLITEHEQLGIQAWLESYHGISCGNKEILDYGDLKGRAGAIQAAINLELHSMRIAQIDIKIEGLNGQLPNLDLFNLASKMCVKEGVYHTFKNRVKQLHKNPLKRWYYYFKNLLSMVATQAAGIPNGNHGLFHRFGIQALTLEGFEQSNLAKGNTRVRFISIGKIIEGTFRSLNNLLERFHQSFFFYLLPSSDRYISIGLYMPSVCLIAGALFIKACAKWFKFLFSNENPSDVQQQKEVDAIKFDQVISIYLLTHFCGILIMSLPKYITAICDAYNYTASSSIFYTIAALSGLFLLFPYFVPFRTCERNMTVLNIFCMLELGTVLICISMNNFSLGIFCAVISVPLALFINPTSCRYYSFLQCVLWILVHPLIVLFTVILLNTYITFPNEALKDILFRGLDATQQATIYSIVDSLIYGNWMFSVVTCVFMPNWLCLWCVACSNIKKAQNVLEDKKNN